MSTHDGTEAVRLVDFMNPNDEETFWMSWTDKLNGQTISASTWVIPDGFTQEGTETNVSVIVDDTTYADANSITLTTTHEKGLHLISNEITTSGGNIWRRSFAVNIDACI